jgi:hypothetical protein
VTADRSLRGPLPAGLARVAETLIDAADWLQDDVALAPLGDRLHALLAGFRTAAPVLASTPADAAAAARAEWLHAVREHAQAIVGWVVILRQTHDPRTSQRGAAAVERNTAALEQLVAQPPG